MKLILKLKNINLFIFILISTVIFITAGNFIEDYKRLIILKLVIIFLISFKINFLKEIKILIFKNKLISSILVLFIISITISFIFSPSTIDQFAFSWLRIRYLDTLTDIFLFTALYLNFKEENINYKNLMKSIIIPGLIFSIFAIIIFITDKHFKNSNEQFLFFDGPRMVGMLMTFLIVFYLGYIHADLQKEKNIQIIFVLTTLITLAILLMGRGTIIAIFITYFFMCLVLLVNKENFKNKFLIVIFSIFISIFLSQIILNITLDDQNVRLIFRGENNLFYTSDRINLWKYGYYIFLEDPLFGKGPGGFAIASHNEHLINRPDNIFFITSGLYHNHPHNFIIQFLVEWGIIGTLLILILFIKLFINSIKFIYTHKNYYLLISGLSILGLASHGFVDGSLYHATFTFYFILSLSILCSEITKKIN